ncbi:uncharacterized protein LOC128270590 [Anopheles cruzii]|uniref:uncharacterized protein LOC128270590 n=1 Tax=Anopheles cruzii TaxID=68878 RepID=UPI0022EC7DF4|nr:uncharacterized protein LOC128270590 [Anopheles cruzii]
MQGKGKGKNEDEEYNAWKEAWQHRTNLTKRTQIMRSLKKYRCAPYSATFKRYLNWPNPLPPQTQHHTAASDDEMDTPLLEEGEYLVEEDGTSHPLFQVTPYSPPQVTEGEEEGVGTYSHATPYSPPQVTEGEEEGVGTYSHATPYSPPQVTEVGNDPEAEMICVPKARLAKLEEQVRTLSEQFLKILPSTPPLLPSSSSSSCPAPPLHSYNASEIPQATEELVLPLKRYAEFDCICTKAQIRKFGRRIV